MIKMKRSPLAPGHLPNVHPVDGVTLHAGYAAMKYPPGRDDVLLVLLEPQTQMAAVYTRSQTASPAIQWCRQAQSQTHGGARALVVMAGNSIAGTGSAGGDACRNLANAVAEKYGLQPEEIQISATGVIGEPFPRDKVMAILPCLGDQPVKWAKAAQAICTTDTFPKLASRCTQIDGVPVTLTGIAKGSGMIAPNMATMLCYLFTDACLNADLLQILLTRAMDKSFHCITVDGDTSTSDTVQVFATHRSNHASVSDADDPRLDDFRSALETICLDLAQQIVRDGEGASKFITIQVRGALNDRDAHGLAMAVANSPLVKTALAGEDANWGRVVMALGKTDFPVNPDRLCISFGDYPVCLNGVQAKAYDEALVATYLKGQEIVIKIDVGMGQVGMDKSGCAEVYTCDLTHGYIDINASYRS